MTLCCLSRDYHVQHTAMSSLLELINQSQSLALVIQDKTRCYQASDANPLSGRLQMVTMPPIYPGLLSTIEQGTDFYQVRKQLSAMAGGLCYWHMKREHIRGPSWSDVLMYNMMKYVHFLTEDVVCKTHLYNSIITFYVRCLLPHQIKNVRYMMLLPSVDPNEHQSSSPLTLYLCDPMQRVAQVLWGQLDVERREQHTSCVELFYRLHCLAPSASICEDIICQALLHRDKVQNTHIYTH